MLAGFVIGLTLGLAVYVMAPGAHWVDIVTGHVIGPIGRIFMRLLFILVIPLPVSVWRW